jgi:nitrite reductase/ring-hydroxylating ferredoxin subunit
VSPADRVPALANTTPVWKRAWIAVALADEVPDNAPVQVLVAGQAWVVIRMDGTLTAFEDICPHRQSPLSVGAVTRADDGSPRLTCAFHGWRFDATGECDLMPTEEGGIFGRHRHGGGHGHWGWHGWHGWAGGHGKHEDHGEHADHGRHGERTGLRPAYGITERYGLIWLAAQEPLAPLPEFPELAGTGTARVRTVTTHASAGQVIDGFLDAGPLGSPEVTTDGWQVAGVFEKRYRITKTAGPHATAHVRADLPHARVGILLTCQPEDLHTTRVYALGIRIDEAPGTALPGRLTPRTARGLEAEHMAAVERDLAALESSPSAVLPLTIDAPSGTPLAAAWRQLMARAIVELSR